MSQRNKIIQLSVVFIGIMVCLYGLVVFNQQLMMYIPLGIRMVLMIVTQWISFLVPGLMMLRNKESVCKLGFVKEKLGRQILLGIGLGLAMSLVLTLIPILCGLEEMVGSTSYTQVWQFIYNFIYCILGVSLAEELVFRGYIFQKLLAIKDNRLFAIIVSSVLFGLFHIYNGNIVQIIMTALIGALLCVFREKFKHCTLLTLIIIHGVYDGLITLWCAVL